MRILVIAIFLATTAFGFFLKYLTYSRRNAALPENVRDVYDEETYRKNQAYKMEGLRFSIICGLIGMAVTLAFLCFNFHHWLYGFIAMRTTSVFLINLFILIVPIIIVSVIDRLMDIYDTFVIEARYGFNKSSVKTFVVDFVKMLFLTLIIGGGLFSLFLLLYGRLGENVFFVFFFVMVAFTLFMSFISPLLIRIIYKLTPLEDGELKTKIQALADKTGYKLKGIYMVDASKRSTKLNAFASGFGKTKTIGLFDTLVEKMTHEEIISILAHEIGHAKKRHILKRAPLSFLSLAVMMLAAYFVVARPEVSQAFGFDGANIAFGVYVLFILLSPVMLVLRIPISAVSRKFEFEADAYEVQQNGVEAAVSAMKKIYREDLGNLTPHPLVVMMEHSHPTLSQRVSAMEKA
ncbi:MAG: M48 family metallopeptidase [Treponema sp.]|nr:M48 family metallopeptidase [Treponema sp.]